MNTSVAEEDRSLTVRDFFAIVQRRWLLILILALVGAGALGGAEAVFQRPEYKVSTQLVVKIPIAASQDNPNYSGQVTGNLQMMNTVAQVVVSRVVMTEVQQDLGLPDTVPNLQKRVSATVPANTQVLTLTATGATRQETIALVNTTANVFVKQAPQLLNMSNMISVLSAAQPSDVVQTAPRVLYFAALGLVAGLLVGVVIAIVLQLTNVRVNDPSEIQSLGLASLGSISSFVPGDFGPGLSSASTARKHSSRRSGGRSLPKSLVSEGLTTRNQKGRSHAVQH